MKLLTKRLKFLTKSRDNNGNVKLDCPAKKQAVCEEISAQVLRKLVEDASKYLGETVTQAVSPFQHTSTTPSVKPTKMLDALLALKCCGLSTNLPLLLAWV